MFSKPIFAANEVDITGLESSVNQAVGMKKFGNLGNLFSQDLINLIFVIIGLLFLSSIIMAGWDYIMSSGDPKKVAGANTRFLNGLFGIIMSLVAYLVVRIILSFLGLGNLI